MTAIQAILNISGAKNHPVDESVKQVYYTIQIKEELQIFAIELGKYNFLANSKQQFR